MSEQEQQGDGGLYTTPDVYQSQSSQDIYQTPDTAGGSTGGIFSGGQQTENAFEAVQDTRDAGSSYGNDVLENGQNPGNEQNADSRQSADGPYDVVQYEEKPVVSQNGNGPYENGAYGNASYGSAPCGQGPYENNASYGNAPYGKSPYENGQFGNDFYGNVSSGNVPNGTPYGNMPYGNGQDGSNQYGNNQYGNAPYGNNQYGNASYGNNQYGSGQFGGPYGPGGGNGQYSPYAAPHGKKHTGLIIGIIATVAVLFLIALFALFYHAFEAVSENKMSNKLADYNQNQGYDIDDFSDDNNGPDDDDYNDYHHNNDDDDYHSDYDDDEYYTLHDDIKKLSYSIDWEYFEYDTDNENVSIIVDYPEISGSHVPNLDKLNRFIEDEISVFTDYYEEEYSKYMNDEGSYFNAYASGYVTYMSEDVLSVVFSETVYTNYYNSAYLYSINIDMRDGVIMENTNIISVDDDFSIDFRYRSDEQNGTIDGVDRMSDQEITDLLTSDSSLIIFYTPQGMEIGFNYDEGWVTVTYHDYRDYLKIF